MSKSMPATTTRLASLLESVPSKVPGAVALDLRCTEHQVAKWRHQHHRLQDRRVQDGGRQRRA
jgi:hypothetical protein